MGLIDNIKQFEDELGDHKRILNEKNFDIYTLQILGNAGQERFAPFMPGYLRGSDGIILTIDATTLSNDSKKEKTVNYFNTFFDSLNQYQKIDTDKRKKIIEYNKKQELLSEPNYRVVPYIFEEDCKSIYWLVTKMDKIITNKDNKQEDIDKYKTYAENHINEIINKVSILKSFKEKDDIYNSSNQLGKIVFYPDIIYIDNSDENSVKEAHQIFKGEIVIRKIKKLNQIGTGGAGKTTCIRNFCHFAINEILEVVKGKENIEKITINEDGTESIIKLPIGLLPTTELTVTPDIEPIYFLVDKN